MYEMVAFAPILNVSEGLPRLGLAVPAGGVFSCLQLGATSVSHRVLQPSFSSQLYFLWQEAREGQGSHLCAHSVSRTHSRGKEVSYPLSRLPDRKVDTTCIQVGS